MPQFPPFHPVNNPDGGREAWLTVLGGFCCLFVSFGWISSIGVFQNYYETHQLRHYSPSTIAWIPSLEAFMMFSGGPIVGKIYDSYGVQPLLVVGTFFHVFGLMMTSLCKEYYQFILAQGICSPLGASMIFYPAMSTVSTWFFKKRALAFGVVAAGSSIGGIILPIMVERLLPQVGFGWAMRIAAFLILFLLIIANLTVRSRIPSVPKPMTVTEFIVPLRELPFLLTTIGCFLFFLGMFLPFNYLIVQAQLEGMSANLAGYLIAILNAVSFFGRVIPGYLADKVGRYNVIVVMCVFTFILDFAIWIPAKSNAPIIVFAALYGFGSGAFVSMAPALVAQISPDVSKIGVRTGALFAIISIAALVGSPIGGAIVTSNNGKFTGLQVFCGCMQAGGALFIIAARVVLAGFNPMTKV
ncbi:putative MFS monocarboxylate transporter [Rhizodiscina lignyota]|uniref:MFS monocarboxylate transporter n=1 Tax=Rhizodiscina lignyota TaxID=1504668 RepID=A0A9P4ILP7_9PEZI|nr:putative MFS monocarboxylate transporter [Rhizodiscina lignyota]